MKSRGGPVVRSSSREPALADALLISPLLDGKRGEAFRAALPAQLGSRTSLGELPIVDPSFRRVLRGALEVALNDNDAHLRQIHRSFGELVPGAQLLPDGLFAPDTVSPRLRVALARAGWTHWSVLLEQPFTTALGLTNIGKRSVAELLGTCFERSIEGVVESWSTDPAAGNLGTLLRQERRHPSQPLLDALLECWIGEGPDSVWDAARGVLEQGAPWALDVFPALQELYVSTGDARSAMVFARLCLAQGSRPAAKELGSELGISGARVLQLRDRAAERVRAALAAAPPHWQWWISALRRCLGPLTTEARALAVLVRIEAADPPVAELALWLAGPYRKVAGRPGWLATDPRSVLARSEAGLQADGGIRRLLDVETELGELCTSRDQLMAWLGACGAVVVHDLVVYVGGSLPDAVERLLDAHGKPRSREEIGADLASGGRALEPIALDQACRNHRFSPTSGGQLQLTAWREEAQPGSEQPRPPVPSVDANRFEEEASTVVVASGDERLWLWVRVDADVLRGSEAAVPVALMEGLGLLSLTRRTYSSRWGPITLSYDEAQATRGSVRAVALAAGARAEDTLLLGFSSRGDVTVEVRRGAPGSSPADQPESDDAVTLAAIAGSSLTLDEGGR